MEKTEKKQQITITLSPEAMAKAKEKAAEENRVVSNYIETLILNDNQ